VIRITLTARGEVPRGTGEALAPDRLAAAGEAAVPRMRAGPGRSAAELGEIFDVRSGPLPDGTPELVVRGAGALDGLGARMAAGRLLVEGDAGDRVGAEMAGGEIEVRGSAGWGAGAGMSGGLVRVRGDAGDRAGGALPGDPRGMTGGVLLVHGAAGAEAGAAMRRGLVAVGRSAGARAGLHAIAGTVVVLGDAGPEPGLGTKRGSLVVFGEAPLLPTFRPACDYDPVFVRLLVRALRSDLGFPLAERFTGGLFRRYAGDFAQLGRGEILVWRER
jgi:formylmethanofuran dehydrogenase subunit C